MFFWTIITRGLIWHLSLIFHKALNWFKFDCEIWPNTFLEPTSTTVKPRFKTTPKLRPHHYQDHHLKVPFHWFLLYLNSIVRPPHYKDHFFSDQVVALIVEFYCNQWEYSLLLMKTVGVFDRVQSHDWQLTS